jgi:hypothetical protein
MDTGKGFFVEKKEDDDAREMEKADPDHGGWFREGETIEIRGSNFRVKSVAHNELRLKLLPK